MWGAIKTIFGSGNVIEKGIGLIDDMYTSTEEEIEAKNVARVRLLNAYAPFKITQRFLAIIFSSVFVLSFFLVLVMVLIGKGNIKDVLAVLDVFYIGEIMLSIVLFYFGGGVAEGIIEKAKEGRSRIIQRMNRSTQITKRQNGGGRRESDVKPEKSPRTDIDMEGD